MFMEVATSNAEAIDMVRDRLVDDVGYLLSACGRDNKAPFWALCRTMFPVAESIAYLRYGGELEKDTAARLSKFIHDELGSISAEYASLSSVICQVWRHGLTHTDEPPVLVAGAPAHPGSGTRDMTGARGMSWKLAIGSSDHLQVLVVNDQTAQFTFCLVRFYNDLLTSLEPNRWAHMPVDEVKNRYNLWTVKYLDSTNPNSEKGKAETQIRAFLP